MLRGRPQHEEPPVHRFVLAEVAAFLHIFIVLRLDRLALHDQSSAMKARLDRKNLRGKAEVHVFSSFVLLRLHPSSSPCARWKNQACVRGIRTGEISRSMFFFVFFCIWHQLPGEQMRDEGGIRAPSVHSERRRSSCSPAQSSSPSPVQFSCLRTSPPPV